MLGISYVRHNLNTDVMCTREERSAPGPPSPSSTIPAVHSSPPPSASCIRRTTPLHLAIINGHQAAAHVLLKHNATVDFRDATGCGAYDLFAARHPDQDLAQHPSPDIRALAAALRERRADQAIVMLCDLFTPTGEKPMLVRALLPHVGVLAADAVQTSQGVVDAAAAILAAGPVDLNRPSPVPRHEKQRPLELAVADKHLGVARLLLDHGARVSFVVTKRLEPTIDTDLLRLLLRYKWSTGVLAQGLLGVAARGGNAEAIAMLLGTGECAVTPDTMNRAMDASDVNGFRLMIRFVLTGKGGVVVAPAALCKEPRHSRDPWPYHSSATAVSFGGPGPKSDSTTIPADDVPADERQGMPPAGRHDFLKQGALDVLRRIRGHFISTHASTELSGDQKPWLREVLLAATPMDRVSEALELLYTDLRGKPFVPRRHTPFLDIMLADTRQREIGWAVDGVHGSYDQGSSPRASASQDRERSQRVRRVVPTLLQLARRAALHAVAHQWLLKEPVYGRKSCNLTTHLKRYCDSQPRDVCYALAGPHLLPPTAVREAQRLHRRQLQAFMGRATRRDNTTNGTPDVAGAGDEDADADADADAGGTIPLHIGADGDLSSFSLGGNLMRSVSQLCPHYNQAEACHYGNCREEWLEHRNGGRGDQWNA
jgi:hypothetical protein